MKKIRTGILLIPLFLIAVSVTGVPTMSRADSGARGEALTRVTSRGGGEVQARAGGRGGTSYSRGYSRGGYGYGGHSHSGGYFSGSVYIGPGWGYWDPFFYPYYYTYPAYPYYYTPPAVVAPQEPQEYISPDTTTGDEQTGYWYYCRKPEGYYPYVDRCPSGWMKVVPNTTPPAQSEEDKED
ncbi:hypothetical protein [Geomonas subterranea]|uniref:Uncharacterized protein n=1 Tax=Geomonas subterranea TaxID=2847989 RepID=A0ABX8LIC6_9BACT|nr:MULTISPECIES: hypothetical protein [Geomonas]QXE90661.1 hypothetical protein KP001_20065 [Geomonas subterranea]QXM11258.1 hypothetical protein KP002_09215 [Geomonas subterranea]